MSAEALERALGVLQRAVPPLERAADDGVDRRPVARALEAAFAGLYDAMDGRASVDEALTAARDAIATALAELAGGEGALAEARALLQTAAEALAEAWPAPVDWSPAPMTASPELPTVHALARASVVPRLDVHAPAIPPVDETPYEPLPAPDTFEALEEHAGAARAHVRAHLDQVFEARPREPEPPKEEPDREARFARHWGREQAEDVAMVGVQRRPLLGDDWREVATLEARLVRSADAFCALGHPALDTLERWVLDAPAPEPSRLFAACILAGSMAGRDTLGLVERLVRAQQGEPTMHEAAGEGLVVAPHPHLDALLRRWCRDDDVALRELAAHALARRGALDDETLDVVIRDRPEVAVAAMWPAMARGHAGLDELLVRADEAAHSDLWAQGVVALGGRSKGRALDRARSRPGQPRAAMLCALLDEAGAETERLVDAALATPHPDTIAPLGTIGRPAVVASLLALVGHEDQPVALAAALALERITGAGLFAEVTLDPTLLEFGALDEPQLPEPDTGGFLPLAGETSDPRDTPPEGSPDTVELPAPDPEAWSAWWEGHRGDFDPGTRYRGGRPHGVDTVRAELAGPLLPPTLRRDVADELRVISRACPRFDVRDFVVLQHRALVSWR